jgi:FAD/FMN-containing dehydrogenase
MVLGVEAVLADGSVVSDLKPFVKDNTGYDLKQLFIGSEGTLGLVTRVVLRLRPKPLTQNAALLAAPAFDTLPPLLARLRAGLGGDLSAFELMWRDFYDLVTTPPARGRAVLARGAPFYVLIEAMGASPGTDEDRFEAVLAEALAAGEIEDAAIAKSGSERAELWGLRDDVAQLGRDGPAFLFDVSLRLRDMAGYVEAVRQTLQHHWGNARLIAYGHMGDGNLHFVVSVGDGSPATGLAVETIVFDLLRERGGSISAEHGIGLKKREFLPWSRSAEELSAMRAIKAALDPLNLLNPGKILDMAASPGPSAQQLA